MPNFDFSDSEEVKDIQMNPYSHNYTKLDKIGIFSLQTNYFDALDNIQNQQKQLTQSEFDSDYKVQIQSKMRADPQNASNFITNEVNKLGNEFKIFSKNYVKSLRDIKQKLKKQLDNVETPGGSQSVRYQISEIEKILHSINEALHNNDKIQPEEKVQIIQNSFIQNISNSSKTILEDISFKMPLKPKSELFYSQVAERNFFTRKHVYPIAMPQSLYHSNGKYKVEVYSPDIIFNTTHIPLSCIGQQIKNILTLPSSELSDFQANCLYATFLYTLKYHSDIIFDSQQFIDMPKQLLSLQYYILSGEPKYVLLEGQFQISRGIITSEMIGNIAISYEYDGPQLPKGEVERLKQGSKLVRFNYESIVRIWGRLLNIVRRYVMTRI
ncbi:hypothetical protein SS50377_22010 [Spironucleus salmonicida]|uniref:Uncharacterized protein n=1 Tax=Spironucleus salmonicida TaxID=348837 RepID=V6LMG6_9EUKA|nr:hypothetical protein SS50377_22010 [Spironucleus salmonicida]|eukprot:EST45825.1 hypothetical protein SS50377_14400 [Spironucleus salmonicida]